MSTELSVLLNVQRDIHGRISRSVDNLKKLGMANINLGAIDTRIRLLDQLWEKFESQHDLIIASYREKYTESEYVRSNFFDTAENTYVQQRSALEEHANRIRAASGKTSQSQDGACESSSKTSLPRIKLPIFSGVYEEWPAFRDLFLSVVGENSAISKVERLHYLRSCLKGPPEKLIQSLTITNENFDRAWTTLSRHFENKRELIRSNFAAFTNATKMKADTADELDRVYLAVTTAVNAQESIGRPIESHGTDLFNYLVVELFDPRTRLEWESSISDSREPPELDALLEFIAKRTLALKAAKPKTVSKTASDSSRSAKVHLARRGSENVQCALCKSKHHVMSCGEFKAKPASERKALVEANKLCYNCLGNHFMSKCQSNKTCTVCQARHHTLLHGSYEQSKPVGVSALSAVRGVDDRKAILLATARVDVADRFGNLHPVRVLVDQGSEVSVVAEALVQRLQLRRATSSVAIFGIGGTRSGSTRGKVKLSLLSRVTGAELDLEAFVLPRLSLYAGASAKGQPDWPHVRGLPLADPLFLDNDKVELILGADVCSNILEEGIRKGGARAPLAQNTILGWILSGGCGAVGRSTFSNSLQCTIDQELVELVHQFWEQEREPSSLPLLNDEEQRCEDIFATSHLRNGDGRYVVRLPFKTSPPVLQGTREPAERLLTAMERKGERDHDFGSLYRAFMDEYRELGHMELVSPSESADQARCYLPHHGVLREPSHTTKLRVVFNGSQRSRSGESLNSSLLVGANLLPALSDVLMRWRWHRFAIVTDIQKMYRQILIHPDDREHQRILWRRCPAEAISEFRLCTVTYGLACAPFLAIRTLKQLASDEGSQHPHGAAALCRDCYVDDVVTGVNSVSDAIALQQELRELCTAGGFPLRKWAANDDRVLDGIPQDHQVATPHAWTGENHATLGLQWDPRADAFAFAIRAKELAKLTKRVVLAETARLFDPLGWLSPVIVRAKILIQSAWLKKLEWDSPLPPSDQQQWRKLLEELPTLKNIRVKRWLDSGDSASEIQIHGFADASERAYAAVVYLRVSRGDVTALHLLAAKSKVAPIRPVSLPRLELCAAALLTNLTHHVCTILNLSTEPLCLWSDSRVALHWINGHASRWRTFVANRVSHIQSKLPSARWCHIPGRDNPADCASRGISPDELVNHPLWWTGPAWLKDSREAWPDNTVELPPTEVPEMRATSVTTSVAVNAEPELLLRFSSLHRLLRVTAWCRRWRRTHVQPPERDRTPTLLPEEMGEALNLWVRTVQRAHYADEINAVEKRRSVPKRSSLLNLSPFLDGSGVLRVGGRLGRSPLPHDERHPMVIPPSSWLARLIIDACHRRTLHGGTQMTLGVLRLKYWIPRGRATVKGWINKCVTCTRWRASTPQPEMGRLPQERVTPARPFFRTGVDYAGPILLRTTKGRGHRSYKAFVAVFVCFCTRAVHLEVVSDYSTDAFLAALRRFVSRRGLCSELFSDCGTNFVGADRALRDMFRASSADSRRIAHALSAEGIRWRFNPPAAPHFGGLWEAAVKSTKHHLRRVIGQTTLTFEEMTTFLAQVEACLNSRPLHALTDDPSDLTALTPGHFLIGAPLLAIPEPTMEDRAIGTLSRWQLLQRMRDHFWSQWSREYLTTLASRPKWHNQGPSPEIGALCLVRSEATPPTRWPMARIIKLHPGEDGVTRVVTVRTASSELIRPLVKIVLLPGIAAAEAQAETA